jgi:hypothetical protein
MSRIKEQMQNIFPVKELDCNTNFKKLLDKKFNISDYEA